MRGDVLVGHGRELISMNASTWEQHLHGSPEEHRSRFAFMTPDHQRVRCYVVEQLARRGKPISPSLIEKELSLATDRVLSILRDLEQHLVFLLRNEAGLVTWAFPVTVDETPHHLSFSTGEQVYAAWAEDAIAAPFVQGRLRKEYLNVEISTSCAHCGQEMSIDVDSNLGFKTYPAGAEPLVFEPHLDWARFSEPNILHAYWRNSVFFWSEEHARQYRRVVGGVDGVFLTLDQCSHSTRIAQGALFDFK